MRFSGFEELLTYWAERTPDAPALRYGQTGEGLCGFACLMETVLKRAEELRASGKTCIGVLCDGSFDCVVTIFAAVRAGLQVVLLDENAPEALLREQLQGTDVDTLWGDGELRSALAPYRTDGVCGGAGRILFFTSGTTERAKAVTLTERSLCASAWNGSARLPLQPEDTLLCLLPLGHVFGFVCGLLWGLSCGACVALGRGARHYLDDCACFRPTAISVVPMLLGFLLKQKCLNPELKLILVGAGECPPSLLAAAGEQGIRVCFGYGLTETSSGVAISVSGDPFAMEICPDDTIVLAEDGEILISAPTCMMEGYYRRPADTEAVLSGGVLRTGDLGRFDAAGRLHITGRKKELLVLGDGTKLFLPEYEARLSAVLGPRDLAVCLLDGRPALVLVGSEQEAQTVWTALRPLMAEYPRGVQIAQLRFLGHPLARTATGKLKRWELQQEVEA